MTDDAPPAKKRWINPPAKFAKPEPQIQVSDRPPFQKPKPEIVPGAPKAYQKPDPTLKVKPRPAFTKPKPTISTRSLTGPEMPINFAPGAETLETLVHSTDAFHVVIGLDPIGTFLSVTGLSVENPVYTYQELGRNRSPVQLPWEGARQGGEVTLGWGTVIRSRFWNWFQAQSTFMMERQPVFIIHMSRRSIPLRVFVLWDAWPKGWSYSDLGFNEVSVEKVTLVYDRMFMLNTALLALMPELTNAVAEAPDLDEVAVSVQPQDVGLTTTMTPFKVVPWEAGAETPGKPVVAPTTAPWVAGQGADEEGGGERGLWEPLPADEEYAGLAGVWSTEALDEEYVGLAGTWKGVDGKKVFPKAAAAAAESGATTKSVSSGGSGGAGGSGGGGGGGAGDGGEGKAVDEEDD